jgi:serine/threonine protein kinase
MSRCPKCQFVTRLGADSHGWNTCSKCGHLWHEEELAKKPSPPPPPPPPPSPGEPTAVPEPPPEAVPAAAIPEPVLPEAPPSAQRRRMPGGKLASDEYLPDDMDSSDERRALSTDRVNSDRAGMAAELQQVVEAAAGAKNDDQPGSDELVSRLDQTESAEDADKSAGGLPLADIPEVGDERIHCPICGHGFEHHAGGFANCPQCHSRFNATTGQLVEDEAEGRSNSDLFEDDHKHIIGRTMGGCAIDRKLGEGGMGAVFHGRQLSLDRDVAIKILAPEMTMQSHFMHRFTQEARILAQINHPNILHVYDFGEDAELNLYYMVMEFVDGEDLADRLHAKRRLPEAEVLEIMYQSAHGLQEAAAKGIIHRDIKPDNLMMTGEGVVKVMDFGLAKNTANITQTNAKIRVGTPAFMSPEQCDGEKLDQRSDQYSLGCTAYVSLTGRLPFEGETPFAIMLKHKADPVPRVCDRKADVDPSVDAMIYRMMSKNRNDRFPSWNEVIDHIRHLLDQHGGPTMTYRKSEVGMPILVGANERQEEASGSKPEHALGPLADLSNPESLLAPVVPMPVVPSMNASTPPAIGTPDPDGSPPVPDVRQPSGSTVRASVARSSEVNTNAVSSSSAFHVYSETDEQGTESRGRQATGRSGRHDSDAIFHKRVGDLRQRSERCSVLVLEAEQLFAQRRYRKAMKLWSKAATELADLRERERCYQRMSSCKQIIIQRRRRRIWTALLLLIVAIGVGAWLGAPDVHRSWADRELTRIEQLDSTRQREMEFQRLLQNSRQVTEWYELFFRSIYAVPAEQRAQTMLDNIAVEREEKVKQAQAEDVLKRLRGLIDDTDVSWFQLEKQLEELGAEVGDSGLRQQVQQTQTQIAPKVTALRDAYSAVNQALAEGQIDSACRLAVELRREYPRAGTELLNSLPRPVLIQVQDGQGHSLTGYTVRVDGVVNVDSPPVAYQCGDRSVQVDVTLAGYLPYRISLDPYDDATEPLQITVELRPGKLWTTALELDEQSWVQLQITEDQRAVVLANNRIAALELTDGSVLGSYQRSELAQGRQQGALRWSPFLERTHSGGLLLGSMDGGLWEWSDYGSPMRRRYQSNLPVINAVQFPLRFKRNSDALVLILDGLQGAIIEGLINGESAWKQGLGRISQEPSLVYREGLVYVFDDRALHIFEEGGEVRGEIALATKRLTAAHWLSKNILVTMTEEGLEYVRFFAGGEALIGLGSAVPRHVRGDLAVADGQIFAVLEDGRCLCWGISNLDQLLAQVWEIPAPIGGHYAFTPVIHDDQLFLTDKQGRITIYNIPNRSLERVYEHERPLRCKPAVYEDKLLLLDDESQLHAYYLPPAP